MPCKFLCAEQNGVEHRLGPRLSYLKRHSKTCRVQVSVLTTLSNSLANESMQKNGKDRKTKEMKILFK